MFNHPTGLAEYLDLLVSVGGNYVRNTMSHWNEGNVFAYIRNEGGLFNLNEFNPEYWDRFAHFLKMAYDRGILVQIEIWETWDHYVNHQSLGGWSYHPFNPDNNMTYTAEESGLPTEINYPPTGRPTDHQFFRTVPDLNDNKLVLEYQTRFENKLLSYTLDYPNILYCINNETGEHLEWGDYWVEYMKCRADDAKLEVYITDMRRNENICAQDHHHYQQTSRRFLPFPH